MDTEKVNESRDNNDIEEDIEEEKVNNNKDEKEVETRKLVELKPTTTHTVRRWLFAGEGEGGCFQQTLAPINPCGEPFTHHSSYSNSQKTCEYKST